LPQGLLKKIQLQRLPPNLRFQLGNPLSRRRQLGRRCLRPAIRRRP